MNKTQAMKALKDASVETCKKTFLRHGVPEPFFGVRYGDMYRIVKEIGTDHALAEELWATGNHDARICATMIADPAQVKATMLDKWVKTASNQLMLDAMAALAGKSKHARRCMEKWIASKQEWVAATGWHILAGGCCGRPGEAKGDVAALSEDELGEYLEHIESNIHASKNRVKHSMNGALIAIALRSPALQKQALAAAKRIGTVEVDHGDTSCKTPDAVSYIKKAAEHQKKGSAKKVAKKVAKKMTKKKTRKPA
ncbi:MAG: DNA alkylation repair protein, partial [Phycisphaerales bacterium JB038]